MPILLKDNSEQLFSKVFGTRRLTDNANSVDVLQWYSANCYTTFTITHHPEGAPDQPWCQWLVGEIIENGHIRDTWYTIHELRHMYAYKQAPRYIRERIERHAEFDATV